MVTMIASRSYTLREIVLFVSISSPLLTYLLLQRIFIDLYLALLQEQVTGGKLIITQDLV